MVVKKRGGGTLVVPTTWSYKDPYETGTVVNYNHNEVRPRRFERIAYGVGRQQMNACSHLVLNFVHHGNISYVATAPNNNKAEYRNLPYFYEFGYTVPVGELPAGLITRALQNCKPKLASEFSLPNFIWEFRDLPKLWTALFNNTRGDITQRGSNLALAYNYGVAPLLGDITRIVKLYQTFLKDYKKFMRGLGKSHVAHAQQEVDSTVDGAWTNVSVGTPYSRAYRSWEGKKKYTVSIKYKYELIGPPPPPLPELFSRYIGLRLNPRIIWDAIPFSFVIDWVAKVGRWLSNFDMGALPVRVILVDACSSFKCEFKREYYTTYTPTGGYTGSVQGNFSHAQLSGKTYQRSPIHIKELALRMFDLEFDNLSVREAGLGALLINVNR